ncbi:hypothetical protein CUJ87_31085 (plasmid) [Paraburkholderia caledonica]|nr:hypothetical protein CUJ87_31085 [Paraburkholderia caledonica]
MVAVAETFNEGDEVLLMRVTGLLMLTLCALAAHMMSRWVGRARAHRSLCPYGIEKRLAVDAVVDARIARVM